MSKVLELIAKRSSGAAERVLLPIIAASCNAKIKEVTYAISKAGNKMIRITFEQVGKVKQTLSEFMRTSDVGLLDGHRKKMNYMLQLCGVTPPTVDTPIKWITDDKGQPVVIGDGTEKREDIQETLDKLEEQYGVRSYLSLKDGETRYRVLATVDAEKVEAYLKAYEAKLKECEVKTIFLEITGQDKNGYAKTIYREAKVA